MAVVQTVLTMADSLKKVAEWLMKHIVIRSKDLQDRSDKMHLDDVEQKRSCEVLIKIDF